MKKIKITVIAAAAEYPGSADILDSCSEFEIIACAETLHAAGVRDAIAGSDIMVVEEAVLTARGVIELSEIRSSQPRLKLLLIADKYMENNVLDAVSLGFSGVIPRAGMRSMLRKAIPALYAGEAWVSRRLAESLRFRMLQQDCMLPAAPTRGTRLN